MSYKYGPWEGGPDPLAPPYDIAGALDEMGDAVLNGSSPAEALRDLLRNGSRQFRGLDDLRREVRDRRRALRESGTLDGTLSEVRELLEEALEAERRALFADPDDSARLAEGELDTLPRDTARAVRQLADYRWRSPEAAQKYAEISDLLRREVLDSQFQGMKQALEGATPEDMQRVKDMLADLNAMLAADARGEHTQEQFEDFMRRHGEFFPENPANLSELVDQLARRAAAASRLMQSLTDEQREQLSGLMQQVMSDMGMAAEMEALRRNLRAARPDLRWNGQEWMDGEEGMGFGDATGALADLADLDALDEALGQDYAGAGLEDIDEEQIQRALGRQAVDDLAALRRIERELERQGYLRRHGEAFELTPKAIRRLGQTALRRVFSRLESTRRGSHDQFDAGAAGDPTGASRQWQYGDEQPLDVVRTVSNAVRRSGPGPSLALSVEDFEVIETESRSSAAVALLVDLSYSMALRGTWGIAKSTALALHHLITTQFPQDRLEIIGFSEYARLLRPAELAGLSWDMVQGTNLQHGLMLAHRHLSRFPEAEPVVLVVTDGEPTTHLTPDGQARFCWPPLPETLELTLAEVDRCTRLGATLNVFMLDDDVRLVAFVEEVARRNGGRVFSPGPDRLGDYVVSDYLNARRGRRARR